MPLTKHEHLPSYLPKKFQRIHLELTNRCNFSCVFCPDGCMTRPRGFMDESLARSALDQISSLDITEKVTFHVMGEPLLHPKFFPILDHAESLRLPVGLTTNGALLRPEIIEKIASRGLHQIDISLQTPDAASFHATRGTTMNFEKYRNRILDLLTACFNHKPSPIFKLRMMTTRFADGMRKQLGIPNFLGTSHALRQTILEWTELVYERLGLEIPDRSSLVGKIGKIHIYGWNVIEILPQVFFETYVLTDWGNAFAEDRIIEANRGYCFGMRDHFAILYTGDVILCCIDFDGKTAQGNLNDQSLVEILNSTNVAEVMRGFNSGRLFHPYCRKCLGSATRLGALVKPVASVLGLRVLKPFFYRRYRVF